MKKTNKNTRADSKSFRYVSKSIHRTRDLRGIGFNLIEELKKELIGQRGVKGYE